jgi:hypothetical protein
LQETEKSNKILKKCRKGPHKIHEGNIKDSGTPTYQHLQIGVNLKRN